MVREEWQQSFSGNEWMINYQMDSIWNEIKLNANSLWPKRDARGENVDTLKIREKSGDPISPASSP